MHREGSKQVGLWTLGALPPKLFHSSMTVHNGLPVQYIKQAHRLCCLKMLQVANGIVRNDEPNSLSHFVKHSMHAVAVTNLRYRAAHAISVATFWRIEAQNRAFSSGWHRKSRLAQFAARVKPLQRAQKKTVTYPV